MPVATILLVFAFVFFCIGTFWGPYGGPAPAPWYGRFSFVSAGLACLTLMMLLGGHAFAR
jgi:hypothetical protein